MPLFSVDLGEVACLAAATAGEGRKEEITNERKSCTQNRTLFVNKILFNLWNCQPFARL